MLKFWWQSILTDANTDPDRVTGKMCLGGGMHCPTASSITLWLQDDTTSKPDHWSFASQEGATILLLVTFWKYKNWSIFKILPLSNSLPSVLWHCWFGVRKSIRPVINWGMRCWHGYLSRMRFCIWSTWCHCHPIVSCFIKIQIGLTFLSLAYPCRPRKEAVKRVSVCLSRILMTCMVAAWHSANIIGRINEVTLCRAQLT